MLLRNATALVLSPPRLRRMDVRVENGLITGSAGTLRPKRGEESIDLSGKFIMPGMVNAHTHLYSALSRGMPGPKRAPRNFTAILKEIWWKLDQSLDEESIYYSALAGSLEAIKYGTTTLLDHHASPDCIGGSLDIIKTAMSAAGIRGVLCYETTDRGGRKRRNAGLRENERFVAANNHHTLFRGTLGAHASFTLEDETMYHLGALAAQYGCGVHMHLAEDQADVEDAKRRRKIDIVDRLERYGLLSPQSILAHGVHLSRKQFGALRRSQSWLVHNPRSNMNNNVGYAPLRWFGRNAALGTDGFPADMMEEAAFGFFRNRESAHKIAFTRIPEMLQTGQRLAGTFFGREFGTLAPGSVADIIVLDYAPPTRLNAGTLTGHFLFGMNAGMVVHSMINGQWVMFNRQLTRIDEEAVMAKARYAAKNLWRRMERN